MSRAPARNGAAPRRPGDEDDICPVCKSSRYLNPSMRFLVNPECYHKMCESCVDRIFSHGPAPCPVAGCARTLRKARFRRQTFEDLHIEREVDIRRRVAGVFNRREEEFESLRDWNNYLEEVENLTWNLLQGVDVKETEEKLDAYKEQNEEGIKQNAAIESQENANTEAQFAAQKEQARLRREAALNEELDERREKEEGMREMVDMMAKGDGDADTIARESQKVVLKKSTARRTAAEKSRQQAAAVPLFSIQGLKPLTQAAPEKEYDPFGGYAIKPEYYYLRDHYEHSWLDSARSDAQITAGGYDVGEYCARAMMEAFGGLGVFVQDEIGGRQMRAEKGVGTASAAAAGGGGEEGVDGDVL
ncbi:MAG: TFIIH/NER complex subunit [Alectoria fallacina]|uniref:RNA polymerase II transcription factor B subunit 3 n=1 Tax=Alectoria fallacina TaxID=1903189 RepID=A0A8H3I0N3_9LECA|nr:MAG: TFIIH/NER complex subunit [Alectoria fallacina]